MAQKRILIVDDDKLVRWTLTQKCTEFGYLSLEAASGEEALRMLQTEQVDAILLDVHLPDLSGIEVLDKLKNAGETRSVIMMTADPQLDDVKAALRLGAYDFISKPINFDELSVTLQNALDAGELRTEVESLRGEVRRRAGYHEVIGVSRKITELMKFVYKVASSEATTILIQGESGTGKDLVAKAIHYRSNRSEKPFVAINCSAIPETLMEAELFGHEKGAFTDAKAMKKGLFEIAAGGTIFLDEIGELPLALQSKLLRTLEDQSIRRLGGVRDIRVDVRVVAASNRNLEDEVAAGRFRQDLYYRLMVIPVFIPPLRSHKEDIPILTAFFIEQFNRRFGKHIEGVTPEAAALMESYSWPGNVRELRNAIQRAMILEDTPRIQADCLPFAPKSRLFMAAAAFPDREDQANTPGQWRRLPNGRFLPDLRIPAGGTSLEEIEKHLVIEALRQTQGNQSRAARLLDISRDTIRYAIKKHGLQDSERQDANP